MPKIEEEPERFLTTQEVAALWQVDDSTVKGWARRGQLESIQTPSGRYRFRESVVVASLQKSGAVKS